MSKFELKVKVTGSYNGHSVKPNQTVDLSFKFFRGDLEETIPLLATVNQNIEVIAKVGLNKPVKIGMFNFNGFNVNRSGEAILKLQSDKDFVNMDNVDIISTNDLITIMFKSNIELEDKDDKDEDEENDA